MFYISCVKIFYYLMFLNYLHFFQKVISDKILICFYISFFNILNKNVSQLAEKVENILSLQVFEIIKDVIVTLVNRITQLAMLPDTCSSQSPSSYLFAMRRLRIEWASRSRVSRELWKGGHGELVQYPPANYGTEI